MRLAKNWRPHRILARSQGDFFGTSEEMEKSTEPIVKEFLELDELKVGVLIRELATEN